MRIVFMGTPDFARTILERLVADGHDVCGVFSRTSRATETKSRQAL